MHDGSAKCQEEACDGVSTATVRTIQTKRTDPEQAVKPPKRIRRRLVIKPIQPTRPRRIRDHRFQLTRRCGAVRTDSDLAVRCRDDGA